MKIFNFFARLSNFFKITFGSIFTYFKKGFQAKLLPTHCSRFTEHFFNHIRCFRMALEEDHKALWGFQENRIHKLRKLTTGLHSLLPSDPHYSYSILISVQNANPKYFKEALFSALQQTAPEFEVLIGYGKDHSSKEVEEIVSEFKSKYPQKLKDFTYAYSEVHEILNLLAKEAKGNYLFVLGAEDWIRPDLLFRCEQLMRLLKLTQPICIYTDEYEVNAKSHPIPGSQIKKPEKLFFPYLFSNHIGKSMLIPKTTWELAAGMQNVPLDKALWDLALRLDTWGACFYHLPFCLYANRKISNKQSLKDSSSFIKNLESYTNKKELKWDWKEGKLPDTYQGIPQNINTPNVQVIIPFKDQKDLTLSAVKSIFKQKGVNVKITAVDNASQDQTIAESIREMGGEVIVVQEPFNFSRLINIGVTRTQTAQNCELLLFFNNDVELEEEALLEMCRWINQPSIGMVGCQLRYPNGLLQHGGIDLRYDRPAHQMIWAHSEHLRIASKQQLTSCLRIADGVTAACSLMTRQLFLEVRGFDEIWYPVAYSDTNLCVKIQSKGLLCLYTPYANGVHHESISRSRDNIEDVESSHWLHQNYLKNH